MWGREREHESKREREKMRGKEEREREKLIILLIAECLLWNQARRLGRFTLEKNALYFSLLDSILN